MQLLEWVIDNKVVVDKKRNFFNAIECKIQKTLNTLCDS